MSGSTPLEPLPADASRSASLPISLGDSDFRSLRSRGGLYVDKTAFISRVFDDPGNVILLPRPRRFGKTTNLSTLRYFVEKSDEERSPLFEGLAIWDDVRAREHFGRYPVIWVTFKDVKKTSWEGCFSELTSLVSNLYREHTYLLDSPLLDENDRRRFQNIRTGQASSAEYTQSLRELSRHLFRHHKQPVVILIDEYDTPIHAAFAAGYYDEAIDFFRTFMGAALKDNVYLFKGVMTGILRIAKESIFSDLNNLRVYSLLHPRYGEVYHAFVLGLLVHIQPHYLVRSNRESGQGRFDVMIAPREAGKPGVVLELKVKKKGETLKQALAKALAQIDAKDYAAELRAVGASPIHKMAFAFDGKKVIAGRLP